MTASQPQDPSALPAAPLRLVPAGPEHAGLWLRWRDERLAQRFNPLDTMTLSDLRRRLEGWDGRLTDRRRDEYRWLILHGEEPVGTAALMKPSWRMGYGEIGYLISEPFQGRGLGTRAVRLLVTHIFQETALRRLQALVSVENIASQRLLERLGFTYEGTLRQYFVIQGKPVDEKLYAMLRGDWRQ
ncbi:MAG: GNAT family N-acetyltransferase [Deltaproteobacteria bacterium]|nr:GNAT family N-acetyltransferase [Deltaproteobacteria bacterium]